MSNYRRLISYIYAYEGGVKGKNIGFAKIEIRNGQCRIHVNVKRIFLGNSDIGVYLLSPQKEILLGRIFIRNGAGEFRVNVNASDVENSGCGMEQCYGLTIHETESTWRTYTTIWEDAVTQAAEVDLADVTADKMRGSATSGSISSASAEILRDLERETEQKKDMTSQEEREKAQGKKRDEAAAEEKEIIEAEKTQPKPVAMGEAGAWSEKTQAEKEPTRKSGQEESEELGQTKTESGEGRTVENSQESYIQENAELGQESPEQPRMQNAEAGQESPKQPGTQNGESLQKEQETDPEGWKRGTPVMEEPGKGAGKKTEGKAVQGIPGGTGNNAGSFTGSAMPEEGIWQGRDSVSEKVLRIAKAFVQGKGQGMSPGTGQGTGQIPRQTVSVPPVSAMVKNPAPSVPEPGDPARLAELDRQEQEEMERGNVWKQMQRRYPKVLAFDYVNGCEILSIKPQDIGMLPRENWTYGNNSFLLHGYYNYRHLILARLENPGGEPRYLLGVPGHYYSNEKNLASMFGFPNFVLAKKQPEQDGRFGYWYTDLRL